MSNLVSIITPMYNNANVINETIKSVLSQTYSNWELILVDDCSSDETIMIVDFFVSKDSRIKLFKHSTNKGASAARNLGTKKARGDYIAFLDADDLWKFNKLKLQLDVFEKNKTDVCFGSYEWINEKGEPLNKRVNALQTLNYKKLLKANYVGNLTGIYNCSSLGKIYTKDLKKRQDWVLWLEALKRSKNEAIGLSETIAYYRITEGSLSSNKLNLIKYNYNVYRKGLGFSTIKSSYYLIVFLYEHLFVKKRLIKSLS